MINNCLLCRPPDPGSEDMDKEPWTLEGLKGAKEYWKICNPHLIWINCEIERLEKEQPKKYTLKKEPFIPPMAKEIFTNRQEPREREPNNGELME